MEGGTGLEWETVDGNCWEVVLGSQNIRSGSGIHEPCPGWILRSPVRFLMELGGDLGV